VVGPRIAFPTGGLVSILTALWAWRAMQAGVHQRRGKEAAEPPSACEGAPKGADWVAGGRGSRAV